MQGKLPRSYLSDRVMSRGRSTSIVHQPRHRNVESLDRKNVVDKADYVRQSRAERSSPSSSRSVSGLDVTLAIRYSTLPSTRECTLKRGPASASCCCRPLAAVEV